MKNNIIFVDFTSGRVINNKLKKCNKNKRRLTSFLYNLKKILIPSSFHKDKKCQVYQFKNIL